MGKPVGIAMRNFLLISAITLLTASCSKVEQRRLTSFQQVKCNVNHTNEKIRSFDTAMGFNFGGVFGYKTECSTDGSGYMPSKSGVDVDEISAISLKCREEYGSIPSSSIDSILADGGKVISVSDVEKSVNIWRINSYQPGDPELIPGNICIGKEYVIEAKVSVFEKHTN